MFQIQKGKIRISVRNLVEFLFRKGDISTGNTVRRNQEAMLEGARLHRKIQKSMGKDYQSEVTLSMEWEEEDYSLVLEGRADGIQEMSDGTVLIDEIKCVYRELDLIEDAEEIHLAQALCYARMYACAHGTDRFKVQITYCNIETEEIRRFTKDYSADELDEWFAFVEREYRKWAGMYYAGRQKRNNSIRMLRFPFDYRQGQKKMTAVTFASMEAGDHIFFQAPTGTGKTISVLYPALQEMGREKAEKVFYLTAKTISRTVVQDTVRLLFEKGLSLREVIITAKEKICLSGQMECDPESCPFAGGHFDRINDALFALLTAETEITREVISEYGFEYKICPYELSLEAARWSDLVVCDYNYVFDPHVSRVSLLPEGRSGKHILLIDEAHNLVERAREMYSARLSRPDILKIRRIFREKNLRIYKGLSSLDRSFKTLYKEYDIEENEKIFRTAFLMENTGRLVFSLVNLIPPLEEYLNDHVYLENREELVSFYFNIRHFYGILLEMDQGYQIYMEGDMKNAVLNLFCIDPSAKLKESMESSLSSICFSATLLPVNYYRKLLAGDHAGNAYSIDSPFSHKNRLVAVAGDVTSRYKRREEGMYRKLIRYLEISLKVKPGNYMVFFPSYEMLKEVLQLAEETSLPDMARLLEQTPSMDESEKEDFLKEFTGGQESSLLGFCVLGSLFSEGIDLQGESLIGVMIIGTGLPRICVEREIIRMFFDNKNENGYDYAYRYPGFNKVLQAAGRTIRSAQDKGSILLMDDRFLEYSNRRLMPGDWKEYYPVNIENYELLLRDFWQMKEE